MAARRRRRNPRPAPAPDGLLAHARRLAAEHRLAQLCALEGQVKAAPARDRPALACLVGTALLDSLRGTRASALYAQVRKQSRRQSDRAQLFLHDARVNLELFDVSRGLQAVQQARDALVEGRKPWLHEELAVTQAALLSAEGHQERAQELARSALEDCDAPERTTLAVQAMVVLALSDLRRGRLDEAETWASQAVDRARPDTGTSQADALRTLAVISANRNDFLPAVVCCQRALRIYRSHRVPRGLLRGYLSLGICYLAMGELDHAELFLGKCREIAENGEDLAWRTRVLGRLGHVHLVRGEPLQALECYQEDLRISTSLDNPVGRGHPELNLGEALLARGELPAAGEHLAKALAHFSTVEDPVGQGHAHLALARCRARQSGGRGEPELEHRRSALLHLWRARNLVEPLDRPELACHCDVAEAQVLVSRRDLEPALARHRAGVAVMERLGDVASATHAAFRLGASLEAIGERDHAVGLYSDALRNAELH